MIPARCSGPFHTPARFQAPKYLSAHMNILHLHLRQVGRGNLIEVPGISERSASSVSYRRPCSRS
ncbi:protein of unknown function (plasmid) [Cupriavidus taiwanensis]|uniref:Uncharacterized protein n=1 Tax=Cupriavidus taiwanensis TaxID=164546 RepID=A0A375IUG5_9BURK|nr:protein of unknown function [Cupriavidus taiwanensis]